MFIINSRYSVHVVRKNFQHIKYFHDACKYRNCDECIGEPVFSQNALEGLCFYRKFHLVKIKTSRRIRVQLLERAISLLDENFVSDACLLKPRPLSPSFAILFIVSTPEFYWSSQGQPLKKSQIWHVNLFHFAERKGLAKNLGRIPPTCSFETCFESRHSTDQPVLITQWTVESRNFALLVLQMRIHSHPRRSL